MECYPTAVQEYLNAFAPHEVPRIINRLLLWAVRYQLALTSTAADGLVPPVASGSAARSAGVPSGAKPPRRPTGRVLKQYAQPAPSETRPAKPASVFGEYPSWWGHEEHKPSRAPGWTTTTVQPVATGEPDEWTTRKKTVDEATQTLAPAVFSRSLKPEQARNEAWTQASPFIDASDADFRVGDVSERMSTPRRNENQESSRDNQGQTPPHISKQHSPRRVSRADNPRPREGLARRRAAPDSVDVKAIRHPQSKLKKPSTAWTISAAAMSEAGDDADEDGEDDGSDDEPRPLAQYTDIWHASDSTRIPGVLRRRTRQSHNSTGISKVVLARQQAPADIVAAFLASSFIQQLEEPENTEYSDLSSDV